MKVARNSRVLRTIPLLGMVLLLCPFAYGKVICVDDDANVANYGSSWTDAYPCLQDALTVAQPGDEIRVAQGIYKPDREVVTGRNARIVSSGDRTATFQLINGVAIKGGYAGVGEPDSDTRDIYLYKTILSGDLNGNDGPNFTNNSENSYHVVTGNGTDETAVLDAFTITGGNADDTYGYGGGMCNNFCTPTVTNCTFSRNHATRGGGMGNTGDVGIPSGPTLTNCTFSGNSASWGGGMCYWAFCSGTLTNCTFSGNTAEDGGGIVITKSSEATLRNCTFTGNRASDGAAGAIDCTGDSSATLFNTILWGDSPNEINLLGSSITVTYSDVQGGWSGPGNINADPLFVDVGGADDMIGTEDDDLRLLLGSPCIDAGDNSAIPELIVTDLDVNPRIVNGTVDMGVYEADVAPAQNVYYVDVVNGNNDNDGLMPQAAFATIQKGIDAAAEGEIVLVYPGLYREEINFLGKALTVQGVAASPAGVPVLWNPGDFAVSFYSGEGPGSILKNFIIRDSFMGIFIADSSPAISNLTIVGNTYGIEAYADSEPDISNTILWNNTDGDLFGCRARYSCVERGGEGNITADPMFVDPDNGDYHIRSERGRYWPEHDIWVLDKVTSPCVDRGDPYADTSNEPMPNGGRINIGAYGGTLEASLSPGEQPSPPSGKASNPYPANWAVDVDRDVILTWTAGLNAVSHDVYFGTDMEVVAFTDTSNTTGTYRGRQAATSYTPPEGAWRYPFYYWRIDQVDSQGNTTKGDVWTFTIVGPPPKGRACFLGDTSVWVDGTLVQISKVAAGQTAAKVACPATATMLIEKLEEHEGTFTCYDVLLESGNCISVAENHYFMTESGRWISLQNLKAGINLKTSIGSIGIKNITKRPMPYIGKVYNLKVKSSDRYLVGKDAIVVRDY